MEPGRVPHLKHVIQNIVILLLFAPDVKAVAANLLRLTQQCQGEPIYFYICHVASLPFACFFHS